MKFENMVIFCENKYEKEKVISFLKDNGCKHLDSFLKEGCYIAVYPETPSFSIYIDNITSSDDTFYDFKKFMEKYAVSDLQKKVEEAKKTLGLNNHELSLKLGHQKRYITNALLDPSEKRQKNIILKIDALLLKESNDLTHDFEGKALHKHIDDGMMISKSEYESMKKEIDHKNQVLDKRNAVLENSIVKVNELENQAKSLQEKLNLSEQDSEKWQCDFWTVSRENIELINSKRCISIWLAVSILVIVLMAVCTVLLLNGVV